MTPRGWLCEAYGPDLPEECFFEQAPSPCSSREVCSSRLAAERERAFGRFQEMAAAGDPVAQDLLREVQGPKDLLGGPGEHPLEAAEVAQVLRQPPALVAMWAKMGIGFRRALRDGKPVVESYDDERPGPSSVTAWFPLDEAGEWTGVQIVDPPVRLPPLGLRAKESLISQGGVGAGRFVCPRCGAASSHPRDKAEGYCGLCHDWTAGPPPPSAGA